jgi:putative PIN family toxin of toxin-antitoxin system
VNSRVILDATLLISYLLDPRRPDRTVSRVVEGAFAGLSILVIPSELLAEVRRVLEAKPYIRDRVDPEDREAFLDLLSAEAEISDRPIARRPHALRDPNDDYLLNAAFFLEIDILVSGDKDLLAAAEAIEEFRILSPREFLDLLGD